MTKSAAEGQTDKTSYTAELLLFLSGTAHTFCCLLLRSAEIRPCKTAELVRLHQAIQPAKACDMGQVAAYCKERACALLHAGKPLLNAALP